MTAHFEDLISAIYQGVEQPAQWPVILQRVADYVGVAACVVYSYEPLEGSASETSGRLDLSYASANLEIARVEGFFNDFEADQISDHLTFLTHALAGDAFDLVEDSVLAPDEAALRQRASVQHLLSRGLLRRLAVALNKDNPHQACLSLVQLEGQGRFSAETKARLATVLPHLAKAIQLGCVAQQLQARHGQLLAAMNNLNIGMCVLDEFGRMMQTNTEFDRQYACHSVFVRNRRRRLLFSRPEYQRLFETLLSSALAHGKFCGRPRKEAIAVSENHALCIEISPLSQLAEMGSAPFKGALLFSLDTSRPVSFDLTPLARMYDLTETEATIVALIADGLTNAQIAERRGRSVATVNTQVKAILAKTGCATRTQLVRMVMTFGGSLIG